MINLRFVLFTTLCSLFTCSFLNAQTTNSLHSAPAISPVQRAVAPQCSGITDLTELTGSFEDGSLGNNYGNNSDCSWYIHPNGVNVIHLNFDQFDLVQDTDFVRIYDGNSTASALLKEFTGSTLPNVVTSSGPEIFVHFSSDTGTTSTGWSINYNCSFITLTSLITDETVTGLTPFEITWNSVNTSGTIDILFSTDGGITFPTTIASGIANTGSYSWTVPNTPVSQGNILVRATSNIHIADTSEGLLTILPQSLHLALPNGGENMYGLEQYLITWTSSNLAGNVNLLLSANAGASFPTQIQNNIANTGSFTWIVPVGIETSQARIKIVSSVNAQVSDTSDANFNISSPVITLVSPNGGEQYFDKTIHAINWTNTNYSDSIDIILSVNGGGNYSDTIAKDIANTGTYSWIIPSEINTTQARIKIQSTKYPVLFDNSNANFEIATRKLLVAHPLAGEVIPGNTDYSVQWTALGITDMARIELSTDSGSSFIPLAAAQSSPFVWSVPNNLATNGAVIQLIATADTSIKIKSGIFTLAPQTITLVNPNGGDTLYRYSNATIQWSSSQLTGLVTIQLSTNGGSSYATTIADNLVNSGSYIWTIPAGTNVSQARIKVSSVVDPTIFDESDLTFYLFNPSITIIQPNGGETFYQLTNHSLNWSSVGLGSAVNILLSVDGGVNYDLSLALGIPNSGTYNWAIPNTLLTTTARIRIESVDHATVFDISNANFSIAEQGISLESPIGGETFFGQYSSIISWTSGGVTGNITIRLSLDGGITYPLSIVNSTINDGTYAWLVPDSITTATARIKVESSALPSVNDASSGNFSILQPAVTVAYPNGGENLSSSQAYIISWTPNSFPGNVDILLSTNGGISYIQTITLGTENDGVFSWLIPSEITTTQARIMVRSVVNTTISDASDGNFTIAPFGLTLLSPNGGEQYFGLSEQTINWSSYSVAGNINILLSVDGGISYPTVIATAAENSGTYAWTVPNTINSNQCRVKIQSVNDTQTEDVSQANFSILPLSITLNTPVAGDTLYNRTNSAINWSSSGPISTIDILLSTNGGITYPTQIANGITNDGNYSWPIPGTLVSQTARIKVQSTVNPQIAQATNGNLRIAAPTITLGFPNGGTTLFGLNEYTIHWTVNGDLGHVNLLLSIDGGVNYNYSIADSIINSGAYTWLVPNNISGNMARIKVEYSSHTEVFDISNANFTIVPQSVTVTQPNGGENYIDFKTYNIRWSSIGLSGNVDIYLSLNGGTTYLLLAGDISNTGAYEWSLNELYDTDEAKIKIQSSLHPSIFDESNAVFNLVKPILTITSPNGGETYTGNFEKVINWTSENVTGNVNLLLSTNGGVNYNLAIANNVPNNGTFNWLIPNKISNAACRVRIESVLHPEINDPSNANFSLVSQPFNITFPNGGDVFRANSNKNITWATTGTISFVDIKVSYNGGASYTETLAENIANAGTFNWSVPAGVTSEEVRVKVQTHNDSLVFDMSDSNFTVSSAPFVVMPLPSITVEEEFKIFFVENLAKVFDDPDDSILTYSATSVPLGAYTYIKNDSLYLTGVEDFSGITDVRVTASDGVFSTTHSFSLIVTGINDSPKEFNLLYPAHASVVNLLNGPINFFWETPFDPDRDTLYYSLHLTGNDIDTVIHNLLAPNYTFTNIAGMQPMKTYNWFVLVTDGMLWSSSKYTYQFGTIEDETTSSPEINRNSFQLAQNVPNPFGSITEIVLTGIPDQIINLTFFNSRGDLIRSEKIIPEPSGKQSYIFDGSSLPVGVYFYRLQSGNTLEIRKMIIAR